MYWNNFEEVSLELISNENFIKLRFVNNNIILNTVYNS